MPVLTGGQVLEREGGQVMPCEGGALLEGGQYNIGDHGLIEEAEEPVMGMGPYRYSGVPADGYKNGIAEKGAYLVDILTGDTYRNTGTKAATVWTAASGGAPEITFFLSPGPIGDTSTHNYPVLLDGSGDPNVVGMVGAWTNDENGNLVPPEDGVYEAVFEIAGVQSVAGAIALETSINSGSSAYAISAVNPYIPAVPGSGTARPVTTTAWNYTDPPVVGPDRSLGGLRVKHLEAASDGADVTFFVRIRKISDVLP